ncbi:uncharacterized protein LOC144215353 [Stigmatopora nigra]
MFVPFCLGLLALTSWTAASDPACGELVKHLQDADMDPGTFIYHVGTSDNQDYLDELKKTNSFWIKLAAIPNTENFTMTTGDKTEGKCSYEKLTASYTNISSTMDVHYVHEEETHHEQYLQTCPDCILLIDKMTWKLPNQRLLKGRYLLLLTKTGTLDDAQLEIFKKQAACLNFQKELHFGSHTDLCPEESG